jgi:hypothetical protein
MMRKINFDHNKKLKSAIPKETMPEVDEL